MKKKLDKAFEKAIVKRKRLLQAKVLELVLDDMVDFDGVKATREKLKWYYDHLEEFDNGK